MRLLDANILMYASFDVFPQHARTKKWRSRVERRQDGGSPYGRDKRGRSRWWVIKPASKPVFRQ